MFLRVVNYPGGSAAVLLPLSPANNYQREILFCGGTVSLDGIWSGTPATPQVRS